MAANNDTSTKSIAELLDDIRADDELSTAPRWSDGNKVRDGIIARAGHKMVAIAAQVHVRPDELERKTAEMTNAVCLYTAGAQHPPNKVMFDFYYMYVKPRSSGSFETFMLLTSAAPGTARIAPSSSRPS